MIKAILTLVVTMLTARYLGTANYGLVNYAASIVTFAAPIMQLGINALLVHEITMDEEHEGQILGTAITLNLLSAVLCIIGITSFAAIATASEKDTIMVCFLYSFLLIFQALEMIQYWFQAKLLSKYFAIATLAAYSCVTLYQIVILVSHKGVYWFALTNAVEYMVLAVLLLGMYRIKGNQKLSFSKSVAKRLLHNGKYYILSGMMVTIFSQTDRIMLKFMEGNEVVGLYAAAITCANMADFVFVAIIDSFRPVLFYDKKTDQRLFEENLSALYSLIIYSSLICGFLMSLCAPVVIHILYGGQYNGAVNILRIVAWYITFSFLGTIRDIWILSEGKQRLLWKINLFGVLCNIILNLLFIHCWGALGAAAASLLTQIFTNLIIGFLMKEIRPNNIIMVRGLNPGILIQQIRKQMKSH